jgi:hypothetical protein
VSPVLGNGFEAFLNIGVGGLLACFILKKLTLLPAKPVAFALALGVLFGRSQMIASANTDETLANGAGGISALVLLWLVWFTRREDKSVNG